MRWFIYGSDCDISYQRISEILSPLIKPGDEVTTIMRPGVNRCLEKYCNLHHIRFDAVYAEGVPIEIKIQVTNSLIVNANRCLFIFSITEPPQLNYAYKIALEKKKTRDIKYDFV